MTTPAGVATIKVIGDASEFPASLQRDLNKAMRLVDVDTKPLGNKLAAGLTGPINKALGTIDNNADQAFAEIGKDAKRAFDKIEREADGAGDDIGREIGKGGEKAEDALEEVGDKSKREFDRVERNADKAGSTIGSSFKKVAGVLVAAFAAVQIGRFFSNAAQSAEDLGSAIANTGQIIKSTGGAAGLLAEDVRAISQELSLKIGVDSVEVQDAANVLLTFKSVSKDTFGTTIGLAADLAAVMHSDLTSATLQLGKAMNDPVRGVTALARAGVQFTPVQKEQIKNFVETNQLAKAQAIVLKEVASQVGGVAEAGADSTDKLAVAFTELKRVAGTALIGLVDEAAPALLGLAADVAPAFASVGESVGELVRALLPILLPLVNLISESLADLAPHLVPLGVALAEILDAVAPLLPVIVELAAALADGLAGALHLLAGPLATLADFLADHPRLVVAAIAVYGAWVLITHQAAIAQALLRLSTIATTVATFAYALAMSPLSAALTIATAKQWLLNLALNANPFGAVVILVGAVVAAFTIAWQTSDKFRAVITDLFGVVDQTNFKMIGMETSLGKANAQLVIATAKAAETAAADATLAGTIQDVASAGRSLIDVWDELHGKMLTADESALAAKQTISALGQTFRDNKFAMDRNSEAGLANRIALQKAAQAAAAAAQAYLDQTGDVAGAARMMERYRGDAVRATGATGKTRDSVAALSREIFKMPKNATTQITVRVIGLDKLRTMNSMLVAAMQASGQITSEVRAAGRPPGLHVGGVTTREGLANLHPQEMVLPLEDSRAVTLLSSALAEAGAGLRATGVSSLGPGDIHLQVFLGTRQIEDIIRVEVGEHDRAVRRRVIAGVPR